jgi:hypothetical protein
MRMDILLFSSHDFPKMVRSGQPKSREETPTEAHVLDTTLETKIRAKY